MKPKISLKKAVVLSRKRWRKNGTYNLRVKCGFCEQWRNKKEILICDKCEFGKKAGRCGEEEALYKLWSNSKRGSEKERKIVIKIRKVIDEIAKENKIK